MKSLTFLSTLSDVEKASMNLTRTTMTGTGFACYDVKPIRIVYSMKQDAKAAPYAKDLQRCKSVVYLCEWV